MKTRTHITMLTLVGFITMSCTSSLQVSNSSSWNDEIYGSSSKPQTSQLALNNENKIIADKKVDSNLNQLEQKYADVIEINMDSIKNDTIIYKAEETNPYERILSDSYQDSYERRLRGHQDPRYGMENWSAYYSSDYWFAQAYDPYYYNIVVMGDQIWVEPRYISAMFGWPRTNFSFGFGWNYGYWNYNSWYWNLPYNYNYYGYNNSYWSGWNDGYWHGSNNNNYYGNNYYYGRRSTGTTDNTITRRNTSAISGVTGNQTTVTGRRDGARTSGTNPVVSTRNTQTRVTPTYGSGSRSESRGNQVAVSRREGSSRSERPTREIGISEPTRRSYNTTYDRSRTTSDNSRTTTGTRQATSTSRGASTPTYNSPGRVSTPSTTSRSSEGTRTSSGSSGSYNPSRGSSSGSSGSVGSSSSSGRSSSSSSSSSKSESGSSSNTRRR